MDTDLLWGVALAVVVFGALGAWFYGCGYADRIRRMRAFAKATLAYAGVGFVVGIAFLTSDLGAGPPQGRMGIVALTVGCFLLIYAAGSALAAANDESLVLINLTGRPLLWTDPEFAPFYALPAVQEQPADQLPPVRPRTCYVVSAELGRVGAASGRTDVFTVELNASTGENDAGPARVRRLLPAVPGAALPGPP